MVEALAKGDEVVTSGGLLGRITSVGENFVEVEVGRRRAGQGTATGRCQR